mgnify:CR=1 FL=1
MSAWSCPNFSCLSVSSQISHSIFWFWQPKSTKNIDAISVNGERYAIKSTSGAGTGVFASIPTNRDEKVYFEFLVLVLFDKDYVLKEIYELNWSQFLKFRKIKPPENKWNIPITQSVKSEAKKIF